MRLASSVRNRARTSGNRCACVIRAPNWPVVIGSAALRCTRCCSQPVAPSNRRHRGIFSHRFTSASRLRGSALTNARANASKQPFPSFCPTSIAYCGNTGIQLAAPVRPCAPAPVRPCAPAPLRPCDPAPLRPCDPATLSLARSPNSASFSDGPTALRPTGRPQLDNL